MKRQLPELRMKQKKLTFLLGETLYRLYKLKAVRFLYTTQGETEEKDVTKLVRLMDYIEERINKISEIYGEEEEDSSDETEITDEETTTESETTQESGDQSLEEKPQEEAVPLNNDELLEKVLPAEVTPEIPLEPESVVETPLTETVPEPENAAEESPSEENLTPVIENESLPTPFEQSTFVAEPTIVAEKETTPAENISSSKNVIIEDNLEDIVATATFASEADRRLFEKNLKQLKKGNERDRQICIFQMAHLAKKDVLQKVYEVAMKDESSLVRLAVIKNISRMKTDESAEFFKLGLNDLDENVRTAAIKGIASHPNDEHRKILDGLLKDENPHIRGLAVTYLGIYFGKEGIKLATRAWIDESSYVRISLIEMLAIVKPDGAFTVIKNLLSDRDESVKEAAEKALEKLMPRSKRREHHVK